MLEKQKNIENFNTEIVDELRSFKNELQLIRDDLKPKTVTAAVPIKADSKNTTAWNPENKVII